MPRSKELSGDSKHRSQSQLELEALYKFYRKTGGSKGHWRCDDGWNSLEEAVSKTSDMLILRGTLESQLPMFGVVWDRNHVISIDLCNNRLKGTIPKEIANLRFVRLIKLRANPSLIGPIPCELTAMPHLRYCYLDGTRLENAFPHNLAHSFQITQFHDPTPDKNTSVTVTFQTGAREKRIQWVVDMRESELFMVHSSLKARHEKPHEATSDIQRSAANATGPERVAAAIKLQRIYRARLERTKFRNFLKALFERHYDSSTGHEFYVDKRTGESMWERPTFIQKTPRKEHESSDGNQDVWQPFDDGYGNTYYWNSVTGESTWEPPLFLTRIYKELRERYGSEKTDEERFELFFRDIDKDETGSIDKDEFARLCGELGMAMSPMQIDKVFGELDTSGDGQLSREEIVAWLTRSFT